MDGWMRRRDREKLMKSDILILILGMSDIELKAYSICTIFQSIVLYCEMYYSTYKRTHLS